MKRVFVIFTVLFLWTAYSELKAQADFTIEIADNQDTTFYLTYCRGDKYRMSDTCEVAQGKAVFKQENNYPEGIYVLTNKAKVRLLEFFLGKDQKFSISVPVASPDSFVTCSGDNETKLFFDFVKVSNTIYRTIKEIGENEGLEQDLKKHKIDSLERVLENYREKMIVDNHATFLSKVLNAMKEPQIPDSIAGNQQKAYHFFKDNYWNNFDLTDARLIRTPLINSKLNYYFEKLVAPVPDSIETEIDRIIVKSFSNLEMRDYLIWYFTEQYQNPKIMGMDRVFVHIADNYFAKYEIENATPSVKEKIMERADILRNLVLGNAAPNLILCDTTENNFMSLRNIKSDFVIIFFWDFDCGVCKKELKILKELYESKKYPIEIFAVASNANFDGWRKFIKENNLNWVNVNGMKSVTQDFHDLYDIYSTPVIYVLDKDKRIIGKKIQANQVVEILEYEMKK